MNYLDSIKQTYFEKFNEGKFSYKQIKSIEPLKDWLDIVYHEIYVLADGTGSIYNESGNSVGYFNYGSIITFCPHNEEYIKASLIGTTSKVSQDSSFGNNPSKIKTFNSELFGEMPLSNFPRIVKLSQVLELLDE